MDKENLEYNDIIEDHEFDGLEYEDTYPYVEQLLEEAADGANKKNILQKLIDLIRKFLRWCIKKIQDIISFFRKKKDVTNANSVVQGILGFRARGETPLKDELITKNGLTYLRVHFNPEITGKGNPSGVAVEDIEIAYNKLAVEIKNNKMRMNLTDIAFSHEDNEIMKDETYSDVGKRREAQGLNKTFVPADNGSGYRSMGMALAILSDKKAYDAFEDIIVGLETKKYTDPKWMKWILDYRRDYNIIDNSVKSHPVDTYECTMDDFQRLNTLLRRANKCFDSFDDATKNNLLAIGPAANKNMIDVMNSLSLMMLQLQMALNYISGALNEVYSIDARFAGSVHDEGTLAKVVRGMIDANIPSKYIAWNTFILCDRKMRGTASQKDPKMGQSRLTIFPKTNKEYVIKIALNEYGVRSNNTEINITKLLQGAPKNYIARVLQSYGPKNEVLRSEYASKNDLSASERIRDIYADKLRVDLNGYLDKNQPNIHIIDIHSENIGKTKTGDAVVTDYGMIVRK